jgi:N-acetylneuraminate synthase
MPIVYRSEAGTSCPRIPQKREESSDVMKESSDVMMSSPKAAHKRKEPATASMCSPQAAQKRKMASDTYRRPKVIAEIGCNHKGEIEIAKELLSLAKACGADVGKFQKRCPKELLTSEQYSAPHPNEKHSYGATYGEHREYLELSLDDHRELQAFCQKIGIEYSASVWDTTSAKEIVSLNPKLIKVGSPSNQHWEMQQVLRDEYAGEVHISTGMTTKAEIEKIVAFWEQGKGDAKNRVVLYNCTSGYPVPFKDVCLLDITTLQDKYQHRVKAVGFSGHHLGVAIDVAACAMGAEWIERHFTKDQSWKGTDHAASLDPDGLAKLCSDLKAVSEAMTHKAEEILPLEREQRKKLKWGEYNKDQMKKTAEADEKLESFGGATM